MTIARDNVIEIKVSNEERAVLKRAAGLSGLSLGAYVRRQALANISPSTSAGAVSPAVRPAIPKQSKAKRRK